MNLNENNIQYETYSIGVVMHFKELKLLEAYIDTMIKESLFLLCNKLWTTSFALMLRKHIILFVYSNPTCQPLKQQPTICP
jgi:hypothetical protein